MVSENEFRDAIPDYTDGNIFILGEGAMYADEMESIKKSIKEIYKRTKFKTVVEIGFGLGYTADEFQHTKPDSHIIIESNRAIYELALEWAEGKDGVEIIFDRWQNVTLPKVDLIYYDAYEMVTPGLPDIQNLEYEWFSGFYYMIDEDFELPERFTFKHKGHTYLQLLTRSWTP